MNSEENNVFSFDVGLNVVPQTEQVSNVVETSNTMDIFNQAQQPLINNDSAEANLFETSIEQPIEQMPSVLVEPVMDLPEMPNIIGKTNEENNLVIPEQTVVSEEFNQPVISELPAQPVIEEPQQSFEVSTEAEPQIQHLQQLNEMFPKSESLQPNNIESSEPVLAPFEPSTLPEPIVQNEEVPLPVEDDVQPVVEQVVSSPMVEAPVIPERTGVITMSDTTPEELNKMVEYQEPEKIETTDIKSLFDRVGINVKEASDIFRKNSEMKEKLDTRFEELKKLQSEVQKTKKAQYEEIEAYKNEVLDKLNNKKDEIERRLIKLKEFQNSLEKEKESFEAYKKAQKAEIEKVQREVQEAYDARREELNHIEDILRNQKDALDEERNQLSLDRIQYEADKNELANNLLKFNEIVDSFTNGMDKIGKE